MGFDYAEPTANGAHRQGDILSQIDQMLGYWIRTNLPLVWPDVGKHQDVSFSLHSLILARVA